MHVLRLETKALRPCVASRMAILGTATTLVPARRRELDFQDSPRELRSPRSMTAPVAARRVRRSPGCFAEQGPAAGAMPLADGRGASAIPDLIVTSPQ